jgi:hypothetical protein
MLIIIASLTPVYIGKKSKYILRSNKYENSQKNWVSSLDLKREVHTHKPITTHTQRPLSNFFVNSHV